MEKCRLYPYKRKDIVTVQELKQSIGWQVSCFNLPEQWKYTQGEGVKIALLDSGVELTHPDLADNLLPGMNILNPNKPPMDFCGHGTHVAGIIAAENNEMGIIGISPAAKIIPVKVLDDLGIGDMVNVAKGVRWAADNGADFICMSLGCGKPMQQLKKAIKYAASKGVVCFCSAGNYATNLLFPSRYKECISISCVDETFAISKMSCVGEGLDFFCPGVDIVSCVPVNSYALMSGTSMACPFLCGVCALLLSYVRKHNIDIVLRTADDYRNLLKTYTIPITDKEHNGKKFFQGFGIIDPVKLLDWARTKTNALSQI